MKREQVARELVKVARELTGASAKRSTEKAIDSTKKAYKELEGLMEEILDAEDAWREEDYDPDTDQEFHAAWSAVMDAKTRLSVAVKVLKSAARGF